MLDSTTSQKSPQLQKSIKSKQELQSFYHYSKIMRLKEVKEVTQKPSQLSINFNLSQQNSIALRQSDHLSNFEFLIQQNSRHNYHRQIREQYQYHSQSALTKNQTEKINWQKYKENQKRIEQALNKQKFNHCLENNQQSITRRRVQRLSSETSTQSKFFIESRPTSKQGTQLQNQVIFDSMQKKQSIKAASTQHQSQIDQYDYEISQQPINFDTLVNKILDKKQEQQSQNDENEEENLEEEEEEFEEYKDEKDIMKIKTEGIYEQIEKQLDNNLRRQLKKQVIKQDNLYNQQVVTANKQTIQKLQQTKKKLKASIKQQLQFQGNQQETDIQQQQQQVQLSQNEILTQTFSPKKTNDEKAKKLNDEYLKELREEQNQYKQNQLRSQQEEEKKQQAKLLEIRQIQEEIERKKNKKEEFIYNQQENDNEEQFLKRQSLLKLDLIESQKKEQERLLREQQLQQKEKEEQLNKAKILEEEKQREIEENKKKEIALLIQKQKEEVEKQVQEELSKQPSKLERQKSVLIVPKQTFQERKRSQEEIETSNLQIKREIELKIQKQKEDDEKEELDQLSFVDFMLRSQNIYDVNYDVNLDYLDIEIQII
ncbi:unnamed protein product (macronuclear) [Paramecium tetraurelia]|uniref:Chromosome undetermined scaffold_1, whole genome shotgun sequence n=1 Tax=Paramecium tetraurelia TaxID=5888 RepID=Q6BFU1_PARTE|nr:hypothetical protein [Paramecium tetraurelia strain d4-2]XP_001423184.1 uncharacterized protein GSPATT00000221001 [Paramecium tetraurelia]CAH03479.1 hypothetical protein, coiled-coil domains [Paramecium tetraurelia]CAK55786.1 unnamed protein product [Paramecium tetraurelia]|eukprot:XP_001423184.1 hypothetical protein (macronuclear) [Paramecium tetraurelia strain d4-2]